MKNFLLLLLLISSFLLFACEDNSVSYPDQASFTGEPADGAVDISTELTEFTLIFSEPMVDSEFNMSSWILNPDYSNRTWSSDYMELSFNIRTNPLPANTELWYEISDISSQDGDIIGTTRVTFTTGN